MSSENIETTVSMPTIVAMPMPTVFPTPTSMPMPMPEPMPVPTKEMDSDSYWREIFDRYDLNKDGVLTYDELKALMKCSEAQELPSNTVKQIMALADTDESGCLDFEEFKAMMHNPAFKEWFGHYMMVYAHIVVPQRSPLATGQWHEYQSVAPREGIRGRPPHMMKFSCSPPPVFMILISLVEVAFFGYDAIYGNTRGDGIIGSIFHYDPEKRKQAWRFITYMLVHSSYNHLFRNVGVQLILGVPLEMMHEWWRVAIVYLAGVTAGSLAQSVADPQQQLVGASGGVAALLTAHISTIIMNYSEMKRALYHLLVFLVLAGWVVGGAVYDLYWGLNENVGHVIHLAGALAGLLVGIGVLRNLKDQKWEKILWRIAMFLFCSLMLAGILANFLWKTRFDPNARKYIISAGGGHRGGYNVTTTMQPLDLD